eukprot:1192490-Prorocentrum_minimum.AAC.2
MPKEGLQHDYRLRVRPYSTDYHRDFTSDHRLPATVKFGIPGSEAPCGVPSGVWFVPETYP